MYVDHVVGCNMKIDTMTLLQSSTYKMVGLVLAKPTFNQGKKVATTGVNASRAHLVKPSGQMATNANLNIPVSTLFGILVSTAQSTVEYTI